MSAHIAPPSAIAAVEAALAEGKSPAEIADAVVEALGLVEESRPTLVARMTFLDYAAPRFRLVTPWRNLTADEALDRFRQHLRGGGEPS